jgi:hypothetical protein
MENLIIRSQIINSRSFIFLTGLDRNTTSVIIPPEITNIGNNGTSCTNFDNLTSIDIPPNVKVIAQNAFSGAKKLTSVNIISPSDDVGISINRKSFLGCTSLTELTINGKCIIGQNAFSGCTSLTKITINGKCAIRKNAFLGCISLNTITVTVDSDIHPEAFLGCTYLKYLTIVDGDIKPIYHFKKYDNALIHNVPVKDEHKKIISNIFNNKIEFVYFNLPDEINEKISSFDGRSKRRSKRRIKRRSNKKSQSKRRSKRRSKRTN